MLAIVLTLIISFVNYHWYAGPSSTPVSIVPLASSPSRNILEKVKEVSSPRQQFGARILADERSRRFCIVFLAGIFAVCVATTSQAGRPNILLVVADDASRGSFGTYGSSYISTPNFDKLAASGVRFTNAYCCNPRCSPSRSCLLTGRYSWQLQEACNHSPFLTDRWKFFPSIFEDKGYFVGYTGKGWGPGVYQGQDTGRSEYTSTNPAGQCFSTRHLKPPFTGISTTDYAANFEDFLTQKPTDVPFCFWLGTREPHRRYEAGSGRQVYGDLGKIPVPAFLPDNEIVRGDLADYAVEVQWFDEQLGRALAILEQQGFAEQTIVLVTSDNGMPFPRGKGNCYDEATAVPLVVRWPRAIKGDRSVTDFVSFPDFAPTLLELAGLPVPEQMTGQSFTTQLLAKASGRIDPDRDSTLVGRERHDVGTTDGPQRCVSYPVRGIRSDKFLYLRNLQPHRWPSGDPSYDLLGCDECPSKSELIKMPWQTSADSLAKLSFQKRPSEELYDLVADPDCLDNLAMLAEMQETKTELRLRMETQLIEQGDPRTVSDGKIFDDYPNSNVYLQRRVYGDFLFDPVAAFERKYSTNIQVAPGTYWGPRHQMIRIIFAMFASLCGLSILTIVVKVLKRRRALQSTSLSGDD